MNVKKLAIQVGKYYADIYETFLTVNIENIEVFFFSHGKVTVKNTETNKVLFETEDC